MIKKGLIAVLFLFGFMTPAQAYIDPNAGGLLFQIMAPVFAIIASLWIVAKEKIVKLFKGAIRALRGNHDKQND